MALNNSISWLTLNSLIDNLVPTLEKSKEIIKFILKSFKESSHIGKELLKSDKKFQTEHSIEIS